MRGFLKKRVIEMPITIKCSVSGCFNARPCRQHAAKQQERRGSAWSRGYDNHWKRYREIFLRNHPLCRECAKDGKLAPATDVDHIKSVRNGQDDPLFWEPSNHQPLCHRHHSQKTAREMSEGEKIIRYGELWGGGY